MTEPECSITSICWYILAFCSKYGLHMPDTVTILLLALVTGIVVASAL